ncbi:MAG: DUF6134 family protein [Rhodospirillaceae bacterium]
MKLPLALYGPEIRFDVHRDGEHIGVHRVTIDSTARSLTVRSEADFEIVFLGVFSYRYVYRSTAEWIDGDLHRLAAEVNDDGDSASLTAMRTGARMRLDVNGQTTMTEAPILPTNHWNANVIGARRVLNTLTGNVNNVAVVRQAREPIPTERGPVMATRYAYTGDLNTEVWYDDAGRWVKLRFKGRDGVPIDYRCRLCQGGPQ